jgi:hypothetical protein
LKFGRKATFFKKTVVVPVWKNDEKIVKSQVGGG